MVWSKVVPACVCIVCVCARARVVCCVRYVLTQTSEPVRQQVHTEQCADISMTTNLGTIPVVCVIMKREISNNLLFKHTKQYKWRTRQLNPSSSIPF